MRTKQRSLDSATGHAAEFSERPKPEVSTSEDKDEVMELGKFLRAKGGSHEERDGDRR